ncbi:MAG TPA: hypothetical protein VMV57_07430 [Terracidiphilus sp.]|nr:hypothetical protein [Terracidiphilus sp.]
MRQDVYRVAYDEANAELTEILSKFEQLRARKDRIEQVVEVLKPLVNMEMQSVEQSNSSFGAPEVVPQEAEQVSQPEPATPMRRTESAFGSGAASRDVREYSRLFNGGQTR